MLIEIENKNYDLNVEIDSFLKNYRFYRNVISKNNRQLQHPMVGAGMRHVKHISGPGKGMSRQPRNKYNNRVIDVPNAVGGRVGRHFPLIKVYRSINKKIKKLIIKQLVYYLLLKGNYKIFEINSNKTKEFLTLLDLNSVSIRKNSKQSVIIICDLEKIHNICKNVEGILCLNINACQDFYKIDIENIENKTIIFTPNALRILIHKYYAPSKNN